MARVCDICGKGNQFGQNIRHRHSGAWKFRAPRTKRTWLPNLQSARVLLANGAAKRLKVCTSCLKKGKIVRAI
ncbi:MAG: 50S ribosomal protein L28 [Armatimonadetes bacterium]|nr:50S ribosomal protein L28 [Armatimonadota bacterium]